VKYAVPVSGEALCGHFGHCEKFALFDVDEAAGKVVNKEILPSPGHQPGFLPGWLAERGVNVVLVGGIGGRAVSLFTANNIRVVSGVVETDPEQAVLRCLAGSLPTGENTCGHDENHVCDH